MAYKEWIASEAKAIGSDGCTVVSELFQWCCFEHDLAYTWKKDPRRAYALHRSRDKNPWNNAPPISREEADLRFRECIQKGSHFGKLSPVSWIRWVGVRIGGLWAWEK